MLVGMGIVYLFLTMLVIAINLMSSMVRRFFPDAPIKTLSVPSVSPNADKLTVAAITAAVHQYRTKHNQPE